MRASSSGAIELLELVCAQPDNDANRLVYADWLLDRGDPRGEFIMLQFKRETHGLTDEEQRREDELVTTYGLAWIGPLATVVDPASMVFRKGFLSECAATSSSDEERRGVVGHPLWATVEKLTCDDAALLSDAGMRSLWSVQFRGMRTLRILSERPTHQRIRSVCLDLRSWGSEATDKMAQIQGFPNLRRLELRFPNRYIQRDAFFDLSPQTYSDLLDTSMVRRLDWLGIKSCLMLPLEVWQDYHVPRPDLSRWVHWSRVAPQLPAGWTLSFQPYHGWRFSMHHEPPGWTLSIGWNNACANSDLRSLELAVRVLGPRDFTRIMVHVLGVYRPHHLALLQRVLGRFPNVVYPE